MHHLQVFSVVVKLNVVCYDDIRRLVGHTMRTVLAPARIPAALLCYNYVFCVTIMCSDIQSKLFCESGNL